MRTLLANLPVGVKGFSHEDCNGDYIVILNARYSHESQQITYLHEVEHILNGDFNSKATTAELEMYRHGG